MASFFYRIRRIQNKIESTPEPYEQNVSSPASNMTINSMTMPISSSAVINSTPMIMTSTQSQINIANSCVGMGGISVIANYGSTGHYTNNVNSHSQTHQPNIASYGLMNHYSNNYIHHSHYHHMNNLSPTQNMSSSVPGTTAMATSSPNNIIITSPISYNMVIRQPKGPDGSKGFQVRTLR